MGKVRSRLFLAGALFLVLLLSSLGGCATKPLPPVGEVRRQDAARVLYQTVEDARLILEVRFQEEAEGIARLLVFKEALVLQVVLQAGVVQVGGEWARRGWRGPVAEAPQALRGWVALLQGWQLARELPGRAMEVHRPDFRLQFQRSAADDLQEMVVWPTVSSSHPAAAAQFLVKFSSEASMGR